MTKINSTKSGELNNEFGVPQGYILRALLFIIYINDMSRILKRGKIIHYADDTLIYAEGETNAQYNIYYTT